ncbi:MlaD family protein [Methyloceanibacter sp.]|jgi:phospholipid/cholesterol/gamma-HCH transport system substrate-binding protein|uniref:MlaD family protein n=1 Tax=Methyloceanibacter sp. TaxID=1965321 RepID=UPI0034886B14
METKANYLMIGGFVLGVLALAFLFVFWMSNFGSGGKRYKIVFESSVAGLTTGSSVGFNGIKVGEVQSFSLDPEDARKVQVIVSVRSDTPVRENSRASIQSMGLTGGSAIQITAGTPDEPFLVATAEDPVPTINADRGGGQGLFDAAPAVMNNANALLQRLNDVVAENEKAINTTLTNVEQFTTMLNERRDSIGQAVTDVSEGAQSFKSLASKLEVSLGQNMDGLTRQAQDGIQEFSAFMREGRKVASTLNRILEKLEANPRGFLLGGSQVPEYTPRGR